MVNSKLIVCIELELLQLKMNATYDNYKVMIQDPNGHLEGNLKVTIQVNRNCIHFKPKLCLIVIIIPTLFIQYNERERYQRL